MKASFTIFRGRPKVTVQVTRDSVCAEGNAATLPTVRFLEMTDLTLAPGTNMDEQDRQDGIRGSFEFMIVGEFCATLLVEERSLTRTK
jgi:hypothetical protein